MLTVAYLANQFPVAVEPYVVEEIRELRRRGVRVISGSVRKSIRAQDLPADFSRGPDNVCLEPLHVMVLLHAAVLMAKRWKLISRLVKRALLQGRENLRARLMALLHTWLGAYYAILLQDLDVDHIHVHHGYFGSWIGMTAARLLGVSFSMTLHGSDLLLHPAYLDEKLRNCRFCITISEYNRRLILQHFAELNPESVILSKLGVDIAAARIESDPFNSTRRKFTLFTAGRLHAVKNQFFSGLRLCPAARSGAGVQLLNRRRGPRAATIGIVDPRPSTSRLHYAAWPCRAEEHKFALSKRRSVRADQLERRNPVSADGGNGE
jgi:hypothetical protein